jgi:hypothetical protein
MAGAKGLNNGTPHLQMQKLRLCIVALRGLNHGYIIL